MNTHDLTQVINYFRGLGFFAGEAGLSDRDLAERLLHAHEEEWGEFIDPSDEHADLLLLRWDIDRVWWQDTEADICQGSDGYIQGLQEWAAISRSTFRPSDICETWLSETGPVDISFVHNGARHTIMASYQDDYLDISVLSQLNRIIAPSGYRFEIYEPFDQSAFVVVLDAAEKDQIIRDRGWRLMVR